MTFREEELIGETTDEHRDEEPLVEPRDDGTVHVSGRISIAELNELLGTDLPDCDRDTAAGLLCALLGHGPAAGETATCGNYTLGAEQVRGRRVTRISLTLWTSFDRVVVPVDFGPRADRAFPVGRAFAGALGARLDAMVVTSRGVNPGADQREARWRARSVGCELDGVEFADRRPRRRWHPGRGRRAAHAGVHEHTRPPRSRRCSSR